MTMEQNTKFCAAKNPEIILNRLVLRQFFYTVSSTGGLLFIVT